MENIAVDGTTHKRSLSGDDKLQENHDTKIATNTTIYEEKQFSNKNINFADIDKFMTILFGDVTPTIQTFDDVDGRRRKDLIRILHGMTQDDIPTLVDINQKGGGVFVMVILAIAAFATP